MKNLVMHLIKKDTNKSYIFSNNSKDIYHKNPYEEWIVSQQILLQDIITDPEISSIIKNSYWYSHLIKLEEDNEYTAEQLDFKNFIVSEHSYLTWLENLSNSFNMIISVY